MVTVKQLAGIIPQKLCARNNRKASGKRRGNERLGLATLATNSVFRLARIVKFIIDQQRRNGFKCARE